MPDSPLIAQLHYGLTIPAVVPECRESCQEVIHSALRVLVTERSEGEHGHGMVEAVTIGAQTVGVWAHPEAAASVALILAGIPATTGIPYIRHLEDVHPCSLVIISLKDA